MRIPPSLQSTHWVMWSSPLLLLILVFTLTASRSTPHVSAARPITTTTQGMTTRVSTNSSARPRPVKTSTTSTTPVIRTLTTVPSTNVRHANVSSNMTASNVKPVANARAESVASGALTGRLSPSFDVADVPLAGPGTWSIATSSPARTTVQCTNVETQVQTQIVVGANESCQLIIRAVTRATSLTWQLTPVA